MGKRESANVEGIELWAERKSHDVLTVPAVVVLYRRRDRKDTHVRSPRKAEERLVGGNGYLEVDTKLNAVAPARDV